MREVAALAGVALKTVSRVVNGEPGVSPELQARVQAAIDRLDYRQDVNASMLRRLGGKTATIGLMLEDVGNPFSSALHRAVEDFARERGVLVLAASCDESPERERELVGTFRARRVDGIIIVPAGPDHSYLLAEKKLGTALVFVDRPARFLDTDSVLSDNAGGSRAAVEHLVKAGHRRIAFLGDDLRIATAEERLRGYTEALAASGAEVDPGIALTGLRDAEAAEAATRKLLGSRRPPTALYTGQNLITLGALRALHAVGLRHDVAHVGFDDVSLGDMLEPGVSVVAQRPSELGRAAADLLFRRLDGDRSAPKHIVLAVDLIPRGSGEIPVRDAGAQ